VRGVQLGGLLLELERPDEARDAFRAAARLEPRHADSWLNLGELAYQAGDFPEAAEGIYQGYLLTPSKPQHLLYAAAAAYVLAKQPAKALPLLESRSGAVKTLPAPASARGSGAMVATKPNRLAHGTARESRRVRWWRLSRRGLRRAAKVSVGAIAGAIACAVVAVGAADGASLVGAHLGPTTGAWNLGTSMVAVAVTEQFLTQRLCGRHVPPLRAQTADAIAALDIALGEDVMQRLEEPYRPHAIREFDTAK